VSVDNELNGRGMYIYIYTHTHTHINSQNLKKTQLDFDLILNFAPHVPFNF